MTYHCLHGHLTYGTIANDITLKTIPKSQVVKTSHTNFKAYMRITLYSIQGAL